MARKSLSWLWQFAAGNLVCVALLLVSAGASAAEEDPVRADELALKSVGLPVDGTGLVAFLLLRSQDGTTPDGMAAHVAKLGVGEPLEQEKACRELIALGPAALSALRQAANDPDAGEAGALARRCLRAIEKDGPVISAAVARLLALRKPEGGAAALLGCLPLAEDETALEEMRTALAALAFRDDRADPALVRALEDASPVRRAAAVDALCGGGQAEPREPLRKLLQDPVPVVRLRAGLALGRAHDAKAVSTLIALLADLPMTQGKAAEDFLHNLAGEQAPKVILEPDQAARQKCRDAWSAWWLTSEAPSLLDEFRRRTLTEADRERGQDLIARLGDDKFEVREKATAELKALGSIMSPLLRQASHHADLEIKARSRACLESIEKDKAAPLSPISARLAALRKHPGTSAALLAFLPFAEDDAIRDEVQIALNVVAFPDGKPDPVVVRALDDKQAVRRAAAAEALGQRSGSDLRPALKKLLADPDAVVRMKTAFALAGARDKDAVPVLIGLVGELPSEQAGTVEEYLRRLAGDRAPADLPAGDGPARQQRRQAWTAWWQAHGPRVELVDPRIHFAASRYLGYTLLVQTQTHQVIELGTDGKPRLTINNLAGPQDAQVLPGDRVLIAEYNSQRVTERNAKGDILWQKQVASWPFSVERLKNGNTFITCRNLLVEVDRLGKEVFTYNRPNNDIMTARKLSDGRIICLAGNSTCFHLDGAGKEVKNFRLQGVSNHGNQVLSNGNVLVPLSWQNKVTEYGVDGRVVWEATVQQPMSAWRLPNGNTLLALQQLPAKVVEIDRQGRHTAELTASAYVVRVKRR